MDDNAGVRLKFQVVQSQSNEFGNAQSRREAQMEHGAIADAVPMGGFGRIEDGLNLLHCEMPDETRVGLLCRDRLNAPDLLQSRRHAILHEVHERFDGGQSNISGIRPIAARRFQMAQEVDDERRIELLQMQLRRGHLKTAARVFKEELERVRIRVTGVIAGVAFDGKALLQECRDMRCDRCHDRPLATKPSQRSAMFLMSSGVACRYQYVSLTVP